MDKNTVQATIKQKIIILPCPCCGSKPKIDKDNGLEALIQCTKCSISAYLSKTTTKNYFVECIEQWNRRA